MDRNDGQEVGISASSVQRIWRPIVGTRKHLDQAVQFAAEGKVKAQIHKQTIFREFSMRNCESVLKPVWELAFSILIEAHLLICAELVRNRALGICYGAVVEVAAQAHCKKVHKRRPTID